MVQSRPFHLRSVILVAVVALLLGALGTVGVSHAAGVTAKQVKKIAKTVVKKQAKKLSVKNSKNLNGKPASAYQDNARVYYTTISTPTQDVAIVVPGLTPGKSYQVSFYAFMSGAPAGASYCFLARGTNGGPLQDYADAGGDEADPGCTGSAVVSMGAGQKLTLFLGAAGNWTTQSSPPDPIQISVVELDTVTTGTLTPAPRSGATPAR